VRWGLGRPSGLWLGERENKERVNWLENVLGGCFAHV